MKIRKTIQKMVAIGTGLTLVGATMFGALAAADLSTYPAPFTKDGLFDATIVLGKSAQPEDVIGSIDIATSLQAANVQKVAVAGASSSTSVNVEGGVNLKGSSAGFFLTDVLPKTNTAGSSKTGFVSQDMPTLLADGILQSRDGDFAYTQKISFPPAGTSMLTAAFAVPSGDSGQDPYLHVVWGSSYNETITFPTNVNISRAEGKTIKLFGKTFVLGTGSSDISTTKLTLYDSANDVTLAKGSGPTTIGTDSVEVVGLNANFASTTEGAATIKVNGEQQPIAKDSSYTLGTPAVRVYVKDITVYNVQTGEGAVRLFIGANKLILSDGNSVQTQKGSESAKDISGTTVDITSSNGKISDFTVSITPSNVDVAGSTKSWLKAGEAFTDPVFKTLKFSFETPKSEVLTGTNRDMIQLEGADPYHKLTFTNKAGIKYDGLIISEGNTTSSPATTTTLKIGSNRDPLVLASGGSIRVPTTQGGTFTNNDKEAFILDAGGSTYILRAEKLYNSSTESYLQLYSYAVGGTTTDKITMTSQGSNNAVTGSYSIGSTLYTFTGFLGNQTVTVSPANVAYLFTNNGMHIDFIGGRVVNATLRFNETSQYNDWEETSADSKAGTFDVNLTYDNSASSQRARLSRPINSTVASGASLGSSTSETGKFQWLSNYGTYVKSTVDSSAGYIHKIWYPKTQEQLSVFIAPVAAASTTTVSGSTADKVVKVPVGASKLDSEVGTDWKAQNVIVVGGPCVNSVAMALKNNPAKCADGYKSGEATIELFEQTGGKVALLVAGYNAQDTRRATRVLYDFATHQTAGTLKGKSVTVKGTSLTDITVGATTVAPVATTTTTTVANATK